MKINFTEGFAEDLGTEMEELKAVKIVGKGAMGTLFLILKHGFDRPLALKAMSKSVLQKQKDGFKRARVEKQILGSLSHPFLPTLVGHVETEKMVGWVVDYCPGGDLNALRRRQPDKIFSENVIRFYAAEIILGVEHLHSVGIVYRDLKAENVLVQEDGHIMLTDFDLSAVLRPPPEPPQSPKRIGKFAFMTSCVSSSSATRVSPVNKKSPNTRTNSFVGTEEYVSPEMLEGGGHDFSVDWWALGVLLYELSSGRTPFTGATRKDTFYNVLVKQPPFSGRWTALRDLIQRLLIKDPRRRLGFNGAEEIKSHFFFKGLDWESVGGLHVAAPPFLPSPVCMDDMAAMQSMDVEKHLLDQADCESRTSQFDGKQTDVFSGF